MPSKVAVIQPYFFPYIGYFELIKAADVLVLLDDVQHIRRGWINRNRLRHDRQASQWRYLSVPLSHRPRSALINEQSMVFPPGWSRRLTQRIRHTYGEHALDDAFAPFVTQLPVRASPRLVDMLAESIGLCMERFGLSARMHLASEFELPEALDAQSRMIELTKCCGGQQYVNLSGGHALYDTQSFDRQGLRLRILEPTRFVAQTPMASRLSVLDLVLAGEVDHVRDHLKGYQ